jgi:hypothetical protein
LKAFQSADKDNKTVIAKPGALQSEYSILTSSGSAAAQNQGDLRSRLERIKSTISRNNTNTKA